MKPVFPPLTDALYRAVVGNSPERTLRGFAVAIEGFAPLAIVGVYADRARHVLVCQFSDRLRAEAKTVFGRRIIAAGARETEALLATVEGPVFSLADPQYAGSDDLLRRVGFEIVAPNTFRLDRMRSLVLQAERLMKAHGDPVEIPVRHYFSEGLYAREVTIPAGTLVTGKIHKRENLNILSKGEISVLVGDRIERIKAPMTIVSEPGTKRIALTHSEVVWTTIHATTERDLAKIEAEFIAEDDAALLASQPLLPEKVAA